MRILTWNLFHGRSLPPSPGGLLDRFAALVSSWEWDVALLQEVPPWWPGELARLADAEQRHARTSRNALLALRRAVASRRPELAKSNGGGCNAILARRSIVEHEDLMLRRWPERRVAQLVRLDGGTCVANFHASARPALAEQELERLWERAVGWARGQPLVLGGDLNLRHPRHPPGVDHVAARDVDHLLALGMTPVAAAEQLDRRVHVDERTVELSDHPPLAVTLRPTF